jgi:AsmA protein
MARRGHRWLGALLVVTVIAAGVAFGGGLVIQRWANARKDALVGELQARLGRPVTAGPVKVSWLRGFAVETGGVEIGPASAIEPGPALRIEKARVRVALWRAIFSLGRRVHVKEASLTGVTANVVRFADGSINWQQIRQRLATNQEREPMSPATRERLRGLVVEHAGIADARVRFVDLVRQGTAEVSDLDLSIAGAGFGEPFQAHLTAAVQSREKNLDLDVTFAAAPGADLSAPVPRRMSLQLRPVELAPLAPFLASGALAELSEGKLAADLKVELGALVPGGQGPTSAKGEAHLTGARIAGGERFDGALETDLLADAAAGNVDVRKLRLALGAMSISSSGKLLDLRGAPRFAGFTVASNGLDFDVLHRYYPPLEQSTGLVLGGPFVVSASADADGGAQRFAARIDLTGASVAVPGKLDKPAGTRMLAEAAGRAEGQTVRCERLVLAMDQARVEGQATLHPASKGARPFEASFQAEPFAVRPLLALLNPKSAEALPDARVGARVKARGQVGRPESMHIEVPAFTASSGPSQLGGSLTVDNLDRPQVTLDAKARFLDLDDFLPAKKEGPARASKPSQTSQPSLLTRVQGRAKLAVERGRAPGLDNQDHPADVSLADARLRPHPLQL